MQTRKYILIIACLLLYVMAPAQDFELRAVSKGFGSIGIQARVISAVQVNTVTHVTDVVFGVKWNSTYNIDLDTAVTSLYNIKKSGTRQTKGLFNFQAFYADNIPFVLPAAWPRNEWVDIALLKNGTNGSGTGDFLLCEPGFDATTNPNIGIEMVDYTPAINGQATGVVLPVQLLSFNVAPADTSINLFWSTTAELNNKGFSVERSEVNAGHFSVKGWVPAATGLSNHYFYADKDLVPNVMYYYRIRQEDKDNNYTYSVVRTGGLGAAIKLLTIAPNPVSEVLHINVSKSVTSQQASFVVYDNGGKAVVVFNEKINGSKTIEKNVSALANGHYILMVTGAAGLKQTIAFEKIQ